MDHGLLIGYQRLEQTVYLSNGTLPKITAGVSSFYTAWPILGLGNE